MNNFFLLCFGLRKAARFNSSIIITMLNPSEANVVLQSYGMESLDTKTMVWRGTNLIMPQVICYIPHLNTNVMYFALENLLNGIISRNRRMPIEPIRETGDPYFLEKQI